MLIIDANNVYFSECLEYHRKTGEQMNLPLVRKILTSKLARINREFKQYHGATGVVVANDARTYWRRDFFPHYKASRKKQRDDATFDWNAFFPCLDEFKQEVKEFFPVISLTVDKAEADDIIAVIAPRVAGAGEAVVIHATDTDDLQLQDINPAIKQWSVIKRKFITPKSEGYSLFEHIVGGDKGDGVPNILSPWDSFVTGTRQKSLMQAKLQDWQNHGIFNPEAFCDAAMLERFHQNRTLVDYRKIPSDIAANIVTAFDEATAPKGKIFNYCVKHRLTNVLKDGGF